MKEYTYQWSPENAEDETLPILKMTKSSVGTFEWCKKQYEFSYIERRPQDTSEAMLKGTVVHNAYEDFYKMVDMEQTKGMNESELIDYFTSIFPIDNYGEVYDTIVAFEADRFLKSELEGTDFIPIGNEIVLNASYTVGENDNPKYPLERDYEVHLQGIVDRLFEENGKYIIVELKTGIWRDSRMSKMRGEMAYYKLLIEEASDEELIAQGLDPNIPVTHWAWFYPESNFFYIEECKRGTQTALRKKFPRLIQAYEQRNFPASYYYKKCVHCSYMGICDAAIENQLSEDW